MSPRKSAGPVRNLILVLGDQLSPSLSALADADPARDVVIMAEVAEETVYVRHHKKKIAFIFAAMRHFAGELEAAGWRVDYHRLDNAAASASFTAAIEAAVVHHRPEGVIATEPGEWRVLAAMRDWPDRVGVPVEIRSDTRFVCPHGTFRAWAEGRKQLRMEFFYREMRRQTRLLMDGDQPAGGRWNFDQENRKPAKADLFMPVVPRFEPDTVTRDVLALVGERFASHFGDLEPFGFAVTRADAEQAFAHFLTHALPRFGDLQDAMLKGEAYLYHSAISMYLNVGLLDPLDLCRRVEAEWRAGRVPINAAEGFIRQIIGWREFVRGIYWREMPDYEQRNALDHTRLLPRFYWTGETAMACVADAVAMTRREAYAHHIQRLMVTGTFALLAGIDPKPLHHWYLAVYADAFEWVELPNTLGMSQFADGGLLASKPYAASGAYIDRMSNYCKGCRYSVKQRTGPGACPFNYLYWDFLARHREQLAGNPRMAQMYRVYDKLGTIEHKAITRSAADFLDALEPARPGEW